jgi:hypothetical protein
MPAGLRELPVVRKKHDAGGSQAPKETTTTRVEVELLRKARMVAIRRDLDLLDYVDGILRPVVERDYARMIQDESQK